MNYIKLQKILFFSSFPLLISVSAYANLSSVIHPFQANYQFNYNGKNLGTATRILSQSGKQWNYVFTAKAVGLASATETSKFSLNGTQIVSSHFNRTSKIFVHSDKLNILFDPSTKRITTNKDGKTRSFAWRSGILDELNVELQIRTDLKNGQLKAHYWIADAKAVESRKFIKQTNEKIKSGSTTHDTIKVVMKHDKPGRETIFWLAPKLDYLPVKVSHVDKETSYGLLLLQYKSISN